MTKNQLKTEAVAYLRELLSPGDVLRAGVVTVSRSGMSRTIRVWKGEQDITTVVGRALGWQVNKAGRLVVKGCGMDMLFHTVDCLAYALFYKTSHDKGDGRTGYLLSLKAVTA